MAAPGLFDLELQEEDAIECDQSDDDAIEVEEVRPARWWGSAPMLLGVVLVLLYLTLLTFVCPLSHPGEGNHITSMQFLLVGGS